MPGKRKDRFPRCATFSVTRPNPIVWTIGALLTLGLLLAAMDMVACGIEEIIKPEMLCRDCNAQDVLFGSGIYRPALGRKTSSFAPNRSCPVCACDWCDYNPYFWKWLRQPIRDEFGRLEF